MHIHLISLIWRYLSARMMRYIQKQLRSQPYLNVNDIQELQWWGAQPFLNKHMPDMFVSTRPVQRFFFIFGSKTGSQNRATHTHTGQMCGE